MADKPFDYTMPGKYDADVLTMVGVLMASCGGIERVITSTLLHYRENGRNVGIVHIGFKRRLKQWHEHIMSDLGGSDVLLPYIASVHKRTTALFRFRDAVVHSQWMGQDNEGTLWLSAIKDKSMKIMTLEMPIPKKEIILTVGAGERLLRDHLKLLVEGVLRRSPKQAREFFQPVSADPDDPTHPSRSGSPYHDIEE